MPAHAHAEVHRKHTDVIKTPSMDDSTTGLDVDSNDPCYDEIVDGGYSELGPEDVDRTKYKQCRNSNKPIPPIFEQRCAFGEEDKMAAEPGFAWTLEKFRKEVSRILDEFFCTQELEEAVRCLQELKCSELNDELVVFSLRKAMDLKGTTTTGAPRPSGLDKLAGLLAALHKAKVVDRPALVRAFEKLFCTWQDLALDVPGCGDAIVELLGECILRECLPSKIWTKVPEGLIKSYSAKRFQKELQKVKEELQKFKAWAVNCLEEYFVSKIAEEVLVSVRECSMREYHHEFVKRAIMMSFDQMGPDARAGGSLEAAISLLVHLHRGGALSKDDLYWGTIRMLGTLEDAILDCPQAPELVGDFLCAAVVEELISVPFLKRCRILRIGGHTVRNLLEDVEKKNPEFARAHIGEREFKNELKQTILEYFDAKDKDEVRRIVQDLQPLGDERAGELVRKVCTFAMERSGVECDLALDLLCFLQLHEELECTQIAAGFEQLHANMDDLVLDVPDAWEMTQSFVRQARERKVLPAGWEPGSGQ